MGIALHNKDSFQSIKVQDKNRQREQTDAFYLLF